MPAIMRAFFYILVKNYLMFRFLFFSSLLLSCFSSYSQCNYVINNIEHVNCNSDNTGSIDISVFNSSAVISWSSNNSFSASSLNISSLFAGKYFLQISDNTGCVSYDSITVEETFAITAEFDLTGLCNIDDSANVFANIFGGTPPYNKLWSTGDTSLSLFNIPSNSSPYTLNITDLNGCISSQLLEIESVSKMVSFMSSENVICKDDFNGSASAYVTNGTPPFSFIWNEDSINIILDNNASKIENLSPNLYTVKIIDKNKCEHYDSVEINYNPKICLDPKKVFSPNNDGINDIWIIENIDIYPNALIEIYSKNGSQVFRRRNYLNSYENSFIGLDYQGNTLPSGTYFYVISLMENNEAFKGSLTIIR